MFVVGTLVVLVVAVVLAMDSFLIVKQKRAVVIERFGKFHSVKMAGLQFKLPIIDRPKKAISLQIQQLDVDVSTKTKDNVFVDTKISVQLRVMPNKVQQAVYDLTDPLAQTKAYIFDVVRSQVPKMTLDSLFESKDEIADSIKKILSEKMNEYGWEIETALVTDLDPAQEVKDAMNKIQTTERLKIAAENEAEADKITTVKNAEAEAEAKRLTGKGYAEMRKEIAKGAKESIEDLKQSGLDASQSQGFMLTTQYLETLQHLGKDGNMTLMLPSGSDGSNKMMTDFVGANMVQTKATPTTKGDKGDSGSDGNTALS